MSNSWLKSWGSSWGSSWGITKRGTVWGEETPVGYVGESWTTWKQSDGNPAIVLGDADWGKLNLTSINHYGPVKNMGNTRGKWLVIKRDFIGSGIGVINFFIRGSTNSFLDNAGSPSWEAYSSPIKRTWQYVQVKAEKV